MIVCLNGRFINAAHAKVSLFDRGFFYGDGIYETLRTYNGEIWQLEAHLERLASSAKLVGMDLRSSLVKIGKDLRSTIRRNGFKESRIRLTVTRGVTSWKKPEMTLHHTEKPTIAITVTPFTPIDSIFYKKGVSAITFPAERFLAEAKTLFFLPQLLARQAAHKAEAFEALLRTREGHLTEGTISNIFIVQDQTIITPGAQILFGVTRAVVLALAKKYYKVIERPLTLFDIHHATECFLTNTSWEIMPVISVDQKRIGKGTPGVVQSHLQKLFKDFQHL